MSIKVNPAVEKIAAVLKAEFDSVGENIRAELREQYRAQFVRKFESFMANVGREKGRIDSRRYDRWHHFVKFDRDAAVRAWGKRKSNDGAPPHIVVTWEDVAAWKEHFQPDLREAKIEADDAYENAREGFVTKNVEKVRDVLGARSDLVDTVVDFRWSSGVFEGTLKVALSNAEFTADVALKYVVRTVPRLTPYYQYPLLFTQAMAGGKAVVRPSQEELRILLGGGSDRDVSIAAAKRFLDEGFCAGGGQEVPSDVWAKISRMYVKTARCPVCGAGVSAQHGKYRKHKTPGATKLSAASKMEADGYCPKSREKVSQDVIDAMGPVEPYKDPKAACEGCGQLARLDAERDWIKDQFLTPDGYATKMKVKSAKYYKHKTSK